MKNVMDLKTAYEIQKNLETLYEGEIEKRRRQKWKRKQTLQKKTNTN